MPFRKIFFLITISILAIFACSKHSPKGTAKVEEIALPGAFADCLMADFDGDSTYEILALTVSEPAAGDTAEPLGNRKGAIISRIGGAYRSDRATLFDLPPDAIVFDTGDIDGDKRPEILYLAHDGLYAMEYASGLVSEPRRVISHPTLFILPTAGSVSYWDIYRPSRAAGKAYVVIPCHAGLAVYGMSGTGAVDSLGILRMRHQARALVSPVTEMREMNPLNYVCSLPTVQIADCGGDGIEDIFVMSDNKVIVFQGDLDGRFDSEASLTFAVNHAADTGGADANSDIQFQVSDLNADNRADIVASKTSGGVMRFESEIDIYLCRARGGYDDKPSFSRKVRKSAGTAYLNDFNGDGRTDLVIPALELGIMPMLKMLILNRLDLNIDIYLQESGRFPDEPSLRKPISASIDLNTGNISYGNNMAFGGDFNGDRLSDFLLDTGKGELRIFYGASGLVLGQNYGWSLELPNPASVYTQDLNGDGRSEILAFYGQDSPDQDKIRLIWVNSP